MLANHIVSMIITSCRQPHYRLLCMSFPCLTLASGQLLSIVQLYFQTMQTGRNGTLTKLLFTVQFSVKHGSSTLE